MTHSLHHIFSGDFSEQGKPRRQRTLDAGAKWLYKPSTVTLDLTHRQFN